MKVLNKPRVTLDRKSSDAPAYADVTHQTSHITPHNNIAYGQGQGVSTSESIAL